MTSVLQELPQLVPLGSLDLVKDEFSTHNSLYEWLTNAERCFNALFLCLEAVCVKLCEPDEIFSTFRNSSLSCLRLHQVSIPKTIRTIQ